METPKQNKRPRKGDETSSSSQNHFDKIISSLISSPSSSSPLSISRSFDKSFEKALSSASSDVSSQDLIVDRTVDLVSLLLDSTKRCFRKRASSHNFNSWPFPQELTIKVFSMLDKKSLMQAMACCTMFHTCAMDPLCYSHIELKYKNVDDGVVRTMIHRAGKELRSIELGHPSHQDPYTPNLLTGSCLSPLSFNHCFIGDRLRKLHIYGLSQMYGCSSELSACSNITDLKIVGLVRSSSQMHELLTMKSFRLIDHLFLEACVLPARSTIDSGLATFVMNIPRLTSLTLIGFGVNDSIAQALFQGSRNLKYMNLSRTSKIKGRFLRDLEDSFKDSPLETIILRDCTSLEEKEVLQFLNSLFTGNLKFIQHIDISNTRGLVSDGANRSKKPNFPLEKLKEERPKLKFVADFTSSLSRSERISRGIYNGNTEEDGWDPVSDSDEEVQGFNLNEDGDGDDGDDDYAQGFVMYH